MERDLDDRSFQRKALEIPDTDAYFDPNIPPQDGQEHLMHMLHERNQCKAVVVNRPKHLPVNDFERTITSSEVSPERPDISHLLPTPEWKAIVSENFIATRDNINRIRREFQYDKDFETTLPRDSNKWKVFCHNNQPLLNIMLPLNQRLLEHLLDVLCDWLCMGEEISKEHAMHDPSLSPSSSTDAAAEDKEMVSSKLDLLNSEKWIGVWLYATLVSLHQPLEPAVHSTLRDIVRTCIRQRNRLMSQEHDKAVPYNIFIHLISSVFAQFDFADSV